jgi:hypothetical protein
MTRFTVLEIVLVALGLSLVFMAVLNQLAAK